MELGKHIVSELKLNDREDWLRHWLAHHVAELILEAERAKDVKARREATKQATETILKIWKHRETLPGDVNPLSRYGEALQALTELRLNPLQPTFLHNLSRHSIASSLHARFPRLMEAVILLPVVRAGKLDRTAAAAVRKFLKKDEQTLLSMFEVRIKVLGGKEADQPASSPEKHDYQTFEEVTYGLIDDTITDLKSIRAGKVRTQARRRSTI